MQFNIRKSNLFKTRGKIECLIVPIIEGEPPAGLDGAPAALCKEIAGLLANDEFAQDVAKTLVYYPRSSDRVARTLLVGLGKREKLDLETLRNAMARVVKRLDPLPVKAATMVVGDALLVDGDFGATVGACVEGAQLADYRFDDCKSKKHRERVGLKEVRFFPSDPKRVADKARVRFSEVGADATLIARNLGNTPANKLTPSQLAAEARRLMKEAGGSCKVLDEARMRKLGMGSLLSVSQGSEEPPHLILMEHKPKGRKRRPKIALVGKGVTFDSGGISIKPASGMEDMKFDMCGAATVVATLWAAAKLDLPVHLIGVVPTVENMPSGRATRPGDVVTALNGKTIEVINTDAEGRLILADALTYAEREYSPDAIVDLATLTGSCIVALGHVAAGLMSKDDALAEALYQASERSGEQLWRLPLFPAYGDQLKSDTADLKNTGGKWGGAVTAGYFLSNFVSETAWAHLDIASTAWGMDGKAYVGKGATGFGVRLLLTWLAGLAGQKV